MESSRTASTSANGFRSEKSRRRNTDYLQIDPSSTFINNTGRGFAEELPENFLDTISPHPVAPSGSSSTENASSSRDEAPTSSAPQLASLTPMSISNEQPSSSFSSASLLSTSYRHIKNEPENDYRFSGSTAGLLSPLSSDSRRRESHDFNTSPFIKEEEDLDSAHLLMSGLQQQELDQLGDVREGSPNEVSSISSMITGEHVVDRSPSPQNYGADPTPMIQRQLIKNEEEATSRYSSKSTRSSYAKARRNGHQQEPEEFAKASYSRNSRKQKKPLGVLNQAASSAAATTNSAPSAGAGSTIPTPPSAHVIATRRIYSTQDSNDPLNAEIGEDIYIDTKDLCKRIAFELKTHSIPQAIFAERILCRSQGTLSDLLRNPKPWNKLKSGRETFRRMYNWVSQPLHTRLAILDMKTDDSSRASGMSPPTPAQNVRTHSYRKSTSDHDGVPASKRPRLVFTDIQKRTLQAIFKETQRPSREMQQTIAEHLRLDLSTVANFFMNARRRSRLGANVDEPTPYQQIRNITPPPGADPNGPDHGPLLGAVMAEMMYKPEPRPDITAEQRQMIERGFGMTRSLAHTITVQQNGVHHEEEEELEGEEDEMNDEELAFEEDVDVGEEEEEEEVHANGDILPKTEVHEKEVKEEVLDDDEYGRAASAGAPVTETKVAAASL